MLYLVRAFPPLYAGAVHYMEIELVVEASFVGAAGASGIEAALIEIELDKGPSPIALAALTAIW